MSAGRKDATDAQVRDLVSLLEKAERLFDAKATRQDRLEKRIQSLQREYELGEVRLGELAIFRGQLESALQAALAGEIREEPPLMEPRTPHSRRGPLGIRSSILEVMAGRPEGPWSPQDVHVALGGRQRLTTPRNVGHTMRKMAADGEIERLGHGAYRLPRKEE